MANIKRYFGGVWAFGRALDWWLYLIPVLLSGIGIATIASLFYGTPRVELAINQGVIALVGIGIMLLLTRFDYRNFRGMTWLIFVGIFLLLLAVELFGTSIFGARRWLEIGSFQLQPSELAKIGSIFILARFFADREDYSLKDYILLLFLSGLPMGLVLIQPDLGTTIVLGAIVASLVVASQIPRRLVYISFLLGLLSIPVAWPLLADYQRERIMTFLNPAADPYGAGYNVLQAMIAVGSGGLFGQGLGRGSQSQLQFLPVAHTDFIFSGVAEATGFIGSIVLLGLLLFLVLRALRVAQLAKDQFGYFIGLGAAILFFVQIVINIGMNLALMPVTGIPLPFVSHGGTTLLVNFALIGVLQSIVLRHKKITF